MAKLRLLLQEGEVSFGCRPRELEELEELLGMLQVSAAVQVKKKNEYPLLESIPFCAGFLKAGRNDHQQQQGDRGGIELCLVQN